ncbi:spore germination protein GerPC [Ectobacillus ponti]|uniref:Spore germination protein GerPC n=1 Tax=Ectobacillus ponti TaxID=2961894 RepID=A0AA42BNQ5_9BACI|nr:spore germination protein GerPC [Ectobacillus ponti]MCP8968245.1 spore germination protein GerPC [Ectobacillus ponti]
MNQDVYAYLQQLQHTLQQQQQRLLELEATVGRLTAELEDFRRNPPASIGRVEYKFDQLKVENLNGTLTIGLTPFQGGGDPAIEDFDIATEQLQVNPEIEVNPDFYQDIIQVVQRYLDEEAYGRILQLEGEQRTVLDDMYRQMMIDDIKKQIEHRLPYYLSQVQPYPEITRNPAHLKEYIIQQMKLDIDKAFLAFIQHVPHNMRKE